LTARSGLPAELTIPAKGLAAPNSTGIACGETETAMSLVTVTTAEALFELSSTLVARTIICPNAGKLPGEVYTPAALIVPTAAVPPEIPFTCQFTAVFVVLLTTAVKFCTVPSNTEAEAGVTLTLMFEGGG
jgi:hypothetical protein